MNNSRFGEDYLGEKITELVINGNFDMLVDFVRQHEKKIARVYYRRPFHNTEHCDQPVAIMVYALMTLFRSEQYHGPMEENFLSRFGIDESARLAISRVIRQLEMLKNGSRYKLRQLQCSQATLEFLNTPIPQRVDYAELGYYIG